jgi:phage shock protein PspC (stress-responsive transcriptional regulator)/heme/copper-type cytochrome/quinol oxidase subunit 2
MKQVININFQGRVVPIETTAFEILKDYTDSLNRHFANEEGKEEIINDIESRIGELFQERLTKGATCITDEDVFAIIKSIGRPEDFEPMDDAQPAAASTSYQQQSQSTSSSTTGHRRLFRNENDKVLGGVCSGLANYFNIDVIVVRIIFVVLFFSGGIGFLTYLIMWIAVPSTASAEIGSTRKKLFRDPDEKMIAGVCSGIGNYFGINPWIPRALFLLPFLSFLSRWGHWGGFWDFGDVVRFTFSPTSLIVYIILWIVIPEASTTSEKLEMKGEKVDMNSIKNSVMEEMKGVGKKASNFGKEASGVISDKAKTVAGDVQNFSRRSRGGLGNVIAMLAKIFAYCVIGVVCCILFGLLIFLAGFSVGVLPIKDYILKGAWQNFYAWGTLVLFIAVPIIGIITWLIRKIAKMKSNSKILRLTFGSLWTLGWVCIILLISTVMRDFRSSSRLDDETVTLTNPAVNKLVVTSTSPFTKKYYARNWIRFEPFENLIDEDTAYVRNINVEIEKSPNDSFQVTIKKMSRGYDRNEANALARLIKFNVTQMDSVLLLDKGLAINKTDKFRNQTVVITVFVPVGKQIRINNGIDNYGHVHFGTRDWGNDWDNDYYDGNDEIKWQTDVNYIMKADGLYTLDGRKADGWNDRGDRKKKNNSRIYKYNATEDSIQRRLDSIDNRRQQKIDSIERRKEHQKDSIDRQNEIEKAKIENGNAHVMNSEPEVLSAIVMPGINILPGIN